jgi:transposase InsO family protein
MCRLTQVNRAGYYRWFSRQTPEDHNMEVRDQIQRICLEHRGNYGYRRVRQELNRRGLIVNEKRVRRLMRAEDLLAARKRKFVVTTASKHALSVFPNMGSTMELDGVNQLWIADITYIRLRREFVYLAVILDAYSRRVIGWALSTSLHAEVTLRALRRAIADRQPPPGVIHHSDQGVQYASGEYVDLLHRHQMIGSMSRKGNPYDNARCESFFKTLKQEEIYCTDYADLDDLETHLEEFLERYYNQRRLHSALGYLSPAAFEQNLARPA